MISPRNRVQGGIRMSLLKLDNIKKVYKSGEQVTAVKGISIGFRENELVSILGPSDTRER